MTASWELVRPRRGPGSLTGLRITAGAVSTFLAFGITMLAAELWTTPSPDFGYRLLAIALPGLLLVPLFTLSSAAARLAARSRDDRLATLRLLGATSGRVRRIAVAESVLVAAAGVLAGTVAATALPLLLAGLHLHGRRLDPAELWLPLWASALIPVLLVGVSALGALLGLRRVTISPLGVRTRAEAPRMSWLRPLIGAAVIAGSVTISQLASPGWGIAGIVAALGVAVLAVMGVLGVVGPFAIALIARRRAARTADAARMVAARGVLDDPRAAWRQVSVIALASFVVVPAGAMLGFLTFVQGHGPSAAILTDEQRLLFVDARTALLLMVSVAFLLAACQIAITEAAAVRERRELYVALDRIGMPAAELNRARRIRVTMPAVVAVVGAALAAATLAFWLVMLAATTAPLFLAGTVLVLAGGIGLIRLAVAASTPLLRRVLTAPERGE